MKLFNFLIIIIAISISFTQSYGFDELKPNPLKYQLMPFDVLHYDVNIDLREYKREINGKCSITVKRNVVYDNDYFVFHLKDLNVISVVANSVPINFSVNEQGSPVNFHYRVNYPNQTDDTVVFVIEYGGLFSSEGGIYPWGGVHYEDAVTYSMGVGIYAPYISTSRHWMPCFDLPQDKATFKGIFRVPGNFKVASNGLLDNISQLSDGSYEYTWEHKVPSATYMLNFAAGPYQLLDYSNYKIPIQIFSLHTDSLQSDFAYSEVQNMNDCFESILGDYPFEKIGYTNVTKGAMEHQTMISMPRKMIVDLFNKKNSNNVTAAHELAHSWFGGSVTPKDFRHAWLNESFATYCESLWLECRNGRADYYKDLLAKSNEYINVVAIREGILPLYDFPREVPSSNYPETIYKKGAVVLGMLDYELEQKGFDFNDILRKYLAKYADSNVETNDFIEFIENETSLDWSEFFGQWVFDAGWPIIQVEFNDSINNQFSAYHKIKQVQNGKIFNNIPIEITYYKSDKSIETIVYSLSESEIEVNSNIKNDFIYDSVKVNQGNIVVGLYESQNIRVKTSITNNEEPEIDFYQNLDYFNINFHSLNEYNKISVTDLFGNIVYTEEMKISIGMNSFNFRLNNSPSGVYIIKMLINGKFFNKKISIIR